jgi:hypothetical protein
MFCPADEQSSYLWLMEMYDQLLHIRYKYLTPSFLTRKNVRGDLSALTFSRLLQWKLDASDSSSLKDLAYKPQLSGILPPQTRSRRADQSK